MVSDLGSQWDSVPLLCLTLVGGPVRVQTCRKGSWGKVSDLPPSRITDMWWKSVPSTTPSSGCINWKSVLGFCAHQATDRKTEYLPFQPVDFSPQTTVDVRSQSSLVPLDFGEWGPFREQIIPCGQWWSVSQFSCSVVSDSLQPRGLQHARLPCPSPTPGACSNSCPSS